jgi:hypothetical protein
MSPLDSPPVCYNGCHMALSVTTLLRLLLDLDPIDLLKASAELFRRLRAHLAQARLQGIYEVLEQQRTVTLQDTQGKVATVETRQRVRFLQNHITALTDYIWGEGEVLAEYRCSPGVPVDRYYEGSRQVVLISLRRHYMAGEEITLRTFRRITGGFTRSEEYWEVEVYHRTMRITLELLFPPERPCRRATVTVRSSGQTVALGPEHWITLPDGRQQLRWVLDKPRLNERYLLRWAW